MQLEEQKEESNLLRQQLTQSQQERAQLSKRLLDLQQKANCQCHSKIQALQDQLELKSNQLYPMTKMLGCL